VISRAWGTRAPWAESERHAIAHSLVVDASRR